MANTLTDQLKALEEKHAQEMRALVEKERGPLIEKRADLKKQLTAVEKQIADLDNAVSGGKKKPATKKASTAGSKPKATDDQILAVVTKIVEENPGIDKPGLLDMTKSKLSEKGFELRGFTSRRLEKYLDNERFSVKADNVSLETANA